MRTVEGISLVLLFGGFVLIFVGVGMRLISVVGLGVLSVMVYLTLNIEGFKPASPSNARKGRVSAVILLIAAVTGMIVPVALRLAFPNTNLFLDFIVGWYAMMLGVLQFGSFRLWKHRNVQSLLEQSTD